MYKLRMLLGMLVVTGLLLLGLVASAEPVNLRWYVWGEHAAYDDLAATFMEHNPGITIEVVNYHGSYVENEYLLPRLAGGVPIDVVLLASSRVPALVDLLEPLDDMPGFAEEVQEVIPGLIESYRQRDGRIYMVPQWLNSVGAAYNLTMADVLSLDRESLPRTWEEWEVWAKKATRPDEGIYACDLYSQASQQWAPIGLIDGYLGALLGTRVSPLMGSDGQTILSSQMGQKAMEHLLEYYTRGWTAAGRTFWGHETLMRSFFNTSEVMRLVTAYDFDWTLSRLPLPRESVLDEPVAIEYGGRCNIIPVTSKHPEEAWLFVQFTMSREGQSIYLKHGLAPARMSVDVPYDLHPEFAKVLWEWLPNTVFVTSYKYAEIEKHVHEAYHSIVNIEETVPAALEEAARQINRIWSE